MIYDVLFDLVRRYNGEQPEKLSHIGIRSGQEELESGRYVSQGVKQATDV